MLSIQQMQDIDKHAQDTLGIPSIILMENAGANAARLIHNKHIDLKNKNIIIFCGTGNNAGDGLVFARHAKKYDANITILLIKPDLRTDETKTNLNIIKNLKIPIITTINHKSGGRGLEKDKTKNNTLCARAKRDAPDSQPFRRLGCHKEPTGKHLTSQNQKYDIAIDAILGIGLKGTVKDPYKTAIETFNNLECTKISLDCPSGIDADTGNTQGTSIHPDITITFHDIKKGLNPKNSGKIIITDIGI